VRPFEPLCTMHKTPSRARSKPVPNLTRSVITVGSGSSPNIYKTSPFSYLGYLTYFSQPFDYDRRNEVSPNLNSSDINISLTLDPRGLSHHSFRPPPLSHRDPPRSTHLLSLEFLIGQTPAFPERSRARGPKQLQPRNPAAPATSPPATDPHEAMDVAAPWEVAAVATNPPRRLALPRCRAMLPFLCLVAVQDFLASPPDRAGASTPSSSSASSPRARSPPPLPSILNGS
uniref:Uncharacterized protein n=1 Tax=Aegilops tauschii subsp. strangulata TaxID=200361 RepID=A0A453G1K6_AEGTS